MEKQTQAKSKNKILKFLPKAASAVNFQNPPFSPSRDKRTDATSKLKAHAGKGFSGPIVSIIPDEARRKPKNGSSYETQVDEPTSPKVSCMGQIKHKKKKANVKTKRPKETKAESSTIRRLFTSVKKDKKSDAVQDHKRPPRPGGPPPGLSQMKRYASGRRETFASFDWTAQIAPAEYDHRSYYSDEERGGSDQDEDDEVIIPFSAPMTVGGDVALQPRKEVNLWKRRTMNAPSPLQVGAN